MTDLGIGASRRMGRQESSVSRRRRSCRRCRPRPHPRHGNDSCLYSLPRNFLLRAVVLLPLLLNLLDFRTTRDDGDRRRHGAAFLVVEATQDLHMALMEDLIPRSSSSLCSSPSAVTNVTFQFDASASWSTTNDQHEDDVFLLRMDNGKPMGDPQSWSIGLGQGGNIYSFVGSFGEAVPPQESSGAPWVDEVWQTVAVCTAENDPAAEELYFIHQAGTFMRDGMTEPFFSPDLAPPVVVDPTTGTSDPLLSYHCSDNQCTVASWGQQAHIPTGHEGQALYLNRYANCDNGVLEVTNVIVNIDDETGGTGDTLDYLNVPWGGVKTSVFRDIILPKAGEVEYEWVHPMPTWASHMGLIDLSETKGYTVFAEGIEDPDTDAGHSYPMPCGDAGGNVVSCNDTASVGVVHLKLDQENGCAESTSHTASWGRKTIRCHVYGTTTVKIPTTRNEELEIRIDDDTKVKITGVLHWSWASHWFFFFVDDETDPDGDINAYLGKDDVLDLYYYDPTPSLSDFTLPCGEGSGTGTEVDCGVAGATQLELELQGATPCVHMSSHGQNSAAMPLIRCIVSDTAVISSGSLEHIAIVVEDGPDIQLLGVLHWSWVGKHFYFWTLTDVDDINGNFTAGDKLTFRHYVPNGKAFEENMALSVVHGTAATLNENTAGGTFAVNHESRLRYGAAADPTRDYTAYTVNTRADISPGQLYLKRHYMVVDMLDEMETKAETWVGETHQELFDQGAAGLSSRTVKLFLHSVADETFGACLSTEACGQDTAVATCTGFTTPQVDHVPYFAIQCGTSTYVGPDRYYFAPPDANSDLKPYICDGQPNERPSYTLLGFFPSTRTVSCSELELKRYDGQLCGSA